MDATQRSREATDKLTVRSYRVRRWSAFEWTEGDDDARKRREDQLEGFAQKIGRKLMDMVPRWEPRVVIVRVERKPQLMFEMVVAATDEDDARKRAMYRIGRALSVKVTPDMNPPIAGVTMTASSARKLYPPQNRTLNPPWGKVEVDALD